MPFDGVVRAPQLRRDAVADVCQKIGFEVDREKLEGVMNAMARARALWMGTHRLDANDTAFFTEQLRFISQRSREIRKPLLKWRQYVPVTNEAPPGAESWSYYQWDGNGMAEMISNYSDDVRLVGVNAKPFSFPLLPYASGYEWSLQDVERAALAGQPGQNGLTNDYLAKKVTEVARSFERRFEQVAAIGEKGTSITGLVNNPYVPVTTAANVGGTTAWGSGTKTPKDVLDDLFAGESAIITATKEVERPDTLLMPLSKLLYIKNTPLYTGAGSDPADTIMSVYLERSEYVRSIGSWAFLGNANAAGNGPRAIWYQRDPSAVHMEVPLEPTEIPPQAVNFAIKVLSRAKSGGVVFERPLSALYMDGI